MDVAKLLLALIVAANLVAYLHGGGSEVKKWWHAKIVGG